MIRKFGLFCLVAAVGLLPLKSMYVGASVSGVRFVTSLSSGESVGLLRSVGGLFFDENRKRLYVSDTSNSRLLSYDAELKFLSALKPEGALKVPTDLVRTADGRFLIVEPDQRALLEIDILNKTIKPIDFSNVPDSSGLFPDKIEQDSVGNVYLTDKSQGRILVFDSHMNFSHTIKPEGIPAVSDIEIDRNDRLYVLNTLAGRIIKYDRSGKKFLEFGRRGKGKGEFYFPVSLAVDRKGLIHVADQHKHTVMVFDRDGNFLFDYGKFGWRRGRLAKPSCVYINDAETIFVIDRDNSRISVFQ